MHTLGTGPFPGSSSSGDAPGLSPSEDDPGASFLFLWALLRPRPATQTSHALAAAPLYLPSPPHSLQVPAPSAAYQPASHGVSVLVPSQEWPSVHAEHAVRVVCVPPDVCDPDAQDSHAAATSVLYSASAPQAEHALAPALAKCPAVHGVSVLPPSHE